MRISSHNQTVQRARNGRALVELMVSSLLLSMAVAACLSLLRATTLFSDRVVRIGIARDMARDVSERLQGTPCSMVAGSHSRGRTDASWTAASSGAFTEVNLHVEFPPHPFAADTLRSVTARAAGWCL